MPNGDTQDYVIKTDAKTFRIKAPKGMEQEQVLSLAAATKPDFAGAHAQYQAQKKAREPLDKLRESEAAYSIFTPTGVSTKPTGGQLGGTPEAVRDVRGAQQQVTEGALSMVGGLPGAGVKGLAGVGARALGSGLGAG